MRIAHFSSTRNYVNFALARDFWNPADDCSFVYSKNLLEKIGGVMTAPVFGFCDKTLKNIKNPLVITALALTAIAIVSVAFYPLHFHGIIVKVAPQLFSIQSGVLKFSIFTITELTILGLGMRTFGRLNNVSLMQAWDRKIIIPISIGSQLI